MVVFHVSTFILHLHTAGGYDSFSPAFHRHGGVSARRSPVVALCGRFRGGVASLPLPEMKGRVGQVWAKFQKPM